MSKDIEFIRYAAIRECAAERDRYRALMRDASGERSMRFYALMAGRKTRKIRKLSRVDSRSPLTKSGSGELSVCVVAPDRRLDALASFPDALLLARKLEFGGYSLYLKLAKETSEEARRRFFMSMVYLYKSDVRLLEKLLAHTSAFSVRHL